MNLMVNNVVSDDIEITQDFKDAIDLMENTSNNAYITGRAGTGKSTLLSYFVKHTKKNAVVLAPTGIAAINIEGSTIHSFFGFEPKLVEQADIKKNRFKADLFLKLEMIIIDEISMVRADLLDGIDYSLRVNRDNELPFGGVQIICFGDIFQLPPVVEKDLAEYFFEKYGGYYFFNAPVFKEARFKYIELQNIFRQRDAFFKELLEKIRHKLMSSSDLLVINQRYNPDFEYVFGDLTLTIASTNKIVYDINRLQMDNLQSKEFTFKAEISGTFDTYPTDVNLALKQGAQIMMLKNDTLKRWANGTLGTIKNLTDNDVEVEINGIVYPVEKATWEMFEYKYDKKEKRIKAVVVGSFVQYPLKLAWAITIHKSQGKTFNKIVIDLGRGAFAHGQTYVALSRCTSLDGVVLKTQIKHRDIIVDSIIERFDRDKMLFVE